MTTGWLVGLRTKISFHSAIILRPKAENFDGSGLARIQLWQLEQMPHVPFNKHPQTDCRCQRQKQRNSKRSKWTPKALKIHHIETNYSVFQKRSHKTYIHCVTHPVSYPKKKQHFPFNCFRFPRSRSLTIEIYALPLCAHWVNIQHYLGIGVGGDSDRIICLTLLRWKCHWTKWKSQQTNGKSSESTFVNNNDNQEH